MYLLDSTRKEIVENQKNHHLPIPILYKNRIMLCNNFFLVNGSQVISLLYYRGPDSESHPGAGFRICFYGKRRRDGKDRRDVNLELMEKSTEPSERVLESVQRRLPFAFALETKVAEDKRELGDG